jgi:protocatechuate 3,4-dioxygenase beta subunit
MMRCFLRSRLLKWVVLIALSLAGCTAMPVSYPVSGGQTPFPSPSPRESTRREVSALQQPTATTEAIPLRSSTPTLERKTANAQSLQRLVLSAFPDPLKVTKGDILLLYGQVTNRAGDPIAGVAVEIWQTDANGIYDHPRAPLTVQRDKAFQFFGTSITDENGFYLFRTIIPGRYPPRPRHIHVKVKRGREELLTTQFYFVSDQDEVRRESIFRSAGENGDLLYIELVTAVDASGRSVLLGRRDVVLNLGSGARRPTPPQAEGPYYPVTEVSQYDNDLVVW